MKKYAFIKDQKLIIVNASNKADAVKIIYKEFKEWVYMAEIKQINEMFITDGLVTIKRN